MDKNFLTNNGQIILLNLLNLILLNLKRFYGKLLSVNLTIDIL